MHYRISRQKMLIPLLGSAAFLLPYTAMAQQISPEWSPLDDSGPVYGGTTDEAPAAQEEKRSRRVPNAAARGLMLPLIWRYSRSR
ncbi:MAG: hypothetical protein HC843_04080 [Sphingomonadales bacterium]|nr:hypothetical protein [Sphingomonadales bacterium]